MLRQVVTEVTGHALARRPANLAEGGLLCVAIPAQGVELLVLAGDSGNALAFGPGLALASARPGTAGTTVIAGHRDTHFSFLAKLVEGDLLQLQLPDGSVRRYQVGGARVVDAARETISMQESGEALLLVTCYPFDALWAGGSLRYTVGAVPLVKPAAAASTVRRYNEVIFGSGSLNGALQAGRYTAVTGDRAGGLCHCGTPA